MRRRLAGAMVVVVVAAACGPTPAPAVRRWVSTRLARIATPDVSVNRIGAWTSDDWFATLEVESPTVPGPSATRLLFFPRTGTNGSTLGPPQVVTPAPSAFGGPIGGERVVALGDQVLTFYLEVAGTWVAAGTLPIELGYTAVAMTEEWLAVRRVPGNPDLPGDGEVRIYALSVVGTSVTAALATTLAPDPAWSATVRNGFGKDVSIDGDLVAVSTGAIPDPGPGAVRVFRATAGTWVPVQSLGGAPNDPGVAMPEFFGSSIGLDEDLLAVAADATTVASADPGHPPVKVGHVQMYRRGSTWTREARVAVFPTPYDPAVVSAYPYRLRVVGDHVGVTVLVTYDPPPGCGFFCFNIGFESWSLDRR